MAVFAAYFDASGDKRRTALSVAGFVASASKWDRFEVEWQAILDRYQVSFFHMTEFVSSHGEFTEWRGKPLKRKKFISALVSCIAKNTYDCFVSSVPLADYHTVNAEYMLRERIGEPYALCAGSCLGGVQQWAASRKIDPKTILTFIEDGDEDKGDFIKRARIAGQKVIPLSKQDARAFQAGDLIGWKSRTAIHGVKTMQTLEDGMNSLRSLQSIKLQRWHNRVSDAESLRQLCQIGRVPKRQRN